MFVPAALDEIEKRRWRDLWRTAVDDAVDELRIDLAEFGPVQASIVPGEPGEPSVNLVLGAATPDAVEWGHLERAVGWAASFEVDYRVPVTPGRPGAKRAERWLIENGHEQGSVRLKLIRDVGPPMPTPASAGVEVVRRESPNRDEGFPACFAESLEMPWWASTFFFDLPGTAGWHCYAAVAGDDALAYVAMLIHGGVAELMLAPQAEDLEHDFHVDAQAQAQAALLRRCIEDAAEAGCEAVFTEVEEPPGDALRRGSRESLVNAGFEQAFVRADWRPPRHAVAEPDPLWVWL